MRSNPAALSLVASLLAGGCDYPVYGFVPDIDSAVADTATGTLEDSAVVDSRADDTAKVADGGDTAPDAEADSLAVDTAVAETGSDALVTKGCVGTVHMFCADFDSVLMPQTGWTDSNLAGGGTNLLDKASFVSPTASYVAAMPGLTAGPEGGATLNEDFTLASATPLIRVEMYIRLDASTNVEDTTLAKISRVSSGNGVEVSIGPTGLAMNIVGTPSSGVFALGMPTPNVWFKLKLEVVLATGTAGSARAYIDDKLIVTQTGVATATTTTSTARLVVGVYQFNTPVTAARANFDDVTFDTL